MVVHAVKKIQIHLIVSLKFQIKNKIEKINKSNVAQAHCYNGVCPTLNSQCESIWGYGGTVADKRCFQQYNPKGLNSGHCGKDLTTGQYLKCEAENVLCGSIQCKDGDRTPTGDATDNTRTIISTKGVEYECK